MSTFHQKKDKKVMVLLTELEIGSLMQIKNKNNNQNGKILLSQLNKSKIRLKKSMIKLRLL
jgi:hypothetical protein